MRLHNINEMKSGWLLGNFEPSLYKTEDFEIAFKSYKCGQVDCAHWHAIATEYNLIVSGIAQFHFSEYYKDENFPDTFELIKGEIIVVEPEEIVQFRAITDCELISIKIPGNGWKDKYLAS